MRPVNLEIGRYVAILTTFWAKTTEGVLSNPLGHRHPGSWMSRSQDCLELHQMATIRESVNLILWRVKTYNVEGNYPSLGAKRWPRLWRDAVDRSRNQRFGYDTWHQGEMRAWKYVMMMMKIRLGKADFRTGWQGSRCNKSIRKFPFSKHRETQPVFSTTLTSRAG